MDKNTLTTLAKEVYRLTVLFPTREPLRYKMREIADDIIAQFVMEENDYLGDVRRLLEVVDSYFQIASAQDWVSPARIDELKNDYLQAGRELDEIKLPREIFSQATVEQEKAEAGGAKAGADKGFVLVDQESKTEIIFPLSKSLMEPVPAEMPLVAPEPAPVASNSNGNEPRVGGAMKETIPAVASISEAGREVKSPAQDEEESDEDDDDDRGGLTDGQIARQNRIAEFLKENGRAQVWEILKIFPNISKRTIRRDFRSMLKQGLIEVTGERNTTAYKLKINIS